MVNSSTERNESAQILLRQAAKAAGGLLNSPTGRALGGMLKGAIHKTLPAVGDVIDNAPPASVGEQVGSGLASEAGQFFGLWGAALGSWGHI